MTYHYLQVDKISPIIVRISLNRPEKRNALNLAMMQEICDVFEELKKDSQIRIVLLYGIGKTFCAGLDLVESTQNIEEMAPMIAQMLATIYQFPLVTIAVMEGDAIAGGAGIISACDFVIATEDVRIGFPEVHRGMVAAVISTLLCRQICQRHARQLLLTGELISSKRAVEMGLITQAVDKKDLSSLVQELIGKILEGSPNALKETKRLLHKLEPKELSHDMEVALATYAYIHSSDDAKEGVAAFLEKREPRWKVAAKYT